MDKDYITKHGLMEAHKEFMRLSEGYLATSMKEADGEDDKQPNAQNDMNGGQGGPENMQGTPGDMQGEPNGMQGPEMGGDQMPGGDEPMGDEMAPGGDVPPMDTPPMDMGQDELDSPEGDDEVIDVEDIVQAQEKLNKKQNSIGHDLGEVDDRIVTLLNAINKIQGAIDKNNNDIVDLKSELEKRMPTKTEKMEMQSLKMYPFNISPQKYWEEKEQDGVYQAQAEQQPKKYELKQKDIDDYSNSEVEKSFDEDLNQTMEKIFKGF